MAAEEISFHQAARDQILRGVQILSDAVIRAVADAYAERIDTLSDMRGSAWYRTEMVRVWVRRAIQRARAKARGE